MNSLQNKVITRVVVATPIKYHDFDEVVIDIPPDDRLILKKVDATVETNFYQCFCGFFIKDNDILFKTNIIMIANIPCYGSIIDDDINYNHVNDFVENYCVPVEKEREYSVNLYNSSITFFITEKCCCNINLRYRYFEQDDLSYAMRDKRVILSKRDNNFCCQSCQYFVCNFEEYNKILVKYPVILFLILNEFLLLNNYPTDIKYLILFAYHVI